MSLSNKIYGWLYEFHEEVIKDYSEEVKEHCRKTYSESIYPTISKFIKEKIEKEKLR